MIAVVVALTFLMWLTLRETFGAKRRLRERLITFPLYVFLAIWSIGFGYGFWWSLISGEEATRTGLAGLQEDARDASAVVAARLDAVRGQLDSVVSWSDSQMAREETSGGSCGTPSGAGAGPLYNARRSVRDSVTTLRDGMTRSWLEPVQADIEQLRQSGAVLGRHNGRGAAAKLRGQGVGHPRPGAQHRRAQQPARQVDRRRDARAGRLRCRCSRAQPASPATTRRWPSACAQAAAQAEQPAELKLREAVFSEGPAGVANAVKNLWSNIGAYMSGAVRLCVRGRQRRGQGTREAASRSPDAT